MRKLLTPGGERVVLVALAVAAVALAVRLSLSHFPVGGHQDEAIVATLSMRSRESGHISVNWDGFPGTFWSKPSLQFSPHTLLQTGVDWISRPVGLASHIRTARGTSIACGTLAVLFVVLVSWELFGTLLGATLAGLVLALSLLHAQDSVYARPDALVALLSVLALGCGARALSRPRSLGWLFAAAAFAGLTLATKYNTAPVLLAPAVPFLFRWRDGVLRGRQLALAALGCALAAALAFVAATPELLVRPEVFLAGIESERIHYVQGHVPHQAFDASDGNLQYWLRYLSLLGFGPLPMLLALTYGAIAVTRRRRPDWLLGSWLLLSAALALMVKVRFERNLEVGVPAMAIAAGEAARLGWGWLAARVRPLARGALAVGALLLLFFPSVLALQRFRDVQFRPARDPEGLPTVARQRRVPLLEAPRPEDRDVDRVILTDLRDPFSRAAIDRWRTSMAPAEELDIESSWSRHGYPFSTIDVYHGPTRLIVLTRRRAATTEPPRGADGRKMEAAGIEPASGSLRP